MKLESLNPNSPRSFDVESDAAAGVRVSACVDTTGVHGHPLLTENTHVQRC